MKLLITRLWPAPALDKVVKHFPNFEMRESTAPLSVDEAREALQNFDIIAPTVGDSFGAETFDGLQGIQTKLLANYGVGYDHIDLAACKAAGVSATNTPGVLTDATAEIAIMLLLMTARRASEGELALRGVDPRAPEARWTGWHPKHMLSTGLAGKTIGIVGLGRIGKEVARRAFHGLRMDVLTYSRRKQDGIMGVWTETTDSMQEICERSDVISLHCNLTPDTHHIFGEPEIAALGHSGIVINTARGEVMDEVAVIKALHDQRLTGAGLDVFQNEPALNPDWLTAPNATLLPHLGSSSVETRVAMGLRSLMNMQAFLKEQPLPDLLAA